MKFSMYSIVRRKPFMEKRVWHENWPAKSKETLKK